MCEFTRNGLLQDVAAVKGIQVFSGHMDNIAETAQFVVNHFLPKGRGTYTNPSIILYLQHKGHESTYSTGVMNPLSINIELVLVRALWQLYYC